MKRAACHTSTRLFRRRPHHIRGFTASNRVFRVTARAESGMTKNHAVLRGGSGDGSTDKIIDCSHSMMNKKVKKNLRRLGGKGLSLEAFVNAKTKSGNYNPSLIKKQKEFYKNAKFVKKYKRLVKAHDELSEPSLSKRISEELNETAEGDIAGQKNDESKRSKPRSIKELYEKRHEEEEKKRIEREAIIQAKKEERQRSEVQRKQERQKMFKKTKSGQPVMKYRIEHLLQTLQGSSG